jgi:hypothetical protein
MKLLSLCLILVLFLFGCVSGKRQVQKLTEKVYLGMSITEFNKQVKNKTLVVLRKDITIYKVERRVWYDSDGSGSGFKFFYFVNNQLTHLDEGEKSVDYRIQIDQNIKSN